jgi:endonuclease/exonuclease/phosphatase family metal-dependent hydrolase
MSFNIRYGTAPDGENAWPHRRDLVKNVIRDGAPDLLGVQEALRDQLDELAEALPEYTVVGVGRNAEGDGEYSAIYYRKGRFDLSDAGTFWLSDTPASPGSRTWGNNLPRICTWVRLFDRTTGRRLMYFNTHWDHESQPARLNSGKLMAERARSLAGEAEPVVITGDFNARDDNPAMAALIDGASLQDSFRRLHPDDRQGTFNGFGERPTSFRIDYVLASAQWQVQEAAIVRPAAGEPYPSDHFPVTATLELRPDETDAPAEADAPAGADSP